MTILKGLELSFPVDGQYVVTELFAAPRPYIAWGLRHQHEGIDIAPIPASGKRWALVAADGVVSGAGYDPDFMGGWVEMFHNWNGEGFWTRYHHIAGMRLIGGDKRKAGDRVDLISDTGYATGVHLHFMMLVERHGKRVAIDPLPFFPQSVRNQIKARG